jgi:hypothetical protein
VAVGKVISARGIPPGGLVAAIDLPLGAESIEGFAGEKWAYVILVKYLFLNNIHEQSASK